MNLRFRSKKASTPEKETFTLAGQEYEAITWWNDSGLRSLYMLLLIPLVTSMTNGYDGMRPYASLWLSSLGKSHPANTLLSSRQYDECIAN